MRGDACRVRGGACRVSADACKSVQTRANACKSVQVRAEVYIGACRGYKDRFYKFQNDMHRVQSLIPVILVCTHGSIMTF